MPHGYQLQESLHDSKLTAGSLEQAVDSHILVTSIVSTESGCHALELMCQREGSLPLWSQPSCEEAMFTQYN